MRTRAHLIFVLLGAVMLLWTCDSKQSGYRVFVVPKPSSELFIEAEHPADDSAGRLIDSSHAVDWSIRTRRAPVRNPSGIYFLDDARGWVHSGKELFFTSNGGQNWKRLTTPSGTQGFINWIHFFDSQNGIVAIQRSPESWYEADFAKDLELRIYRTSDSGATWRLCLAEKNVNISATGADKSDLVGVAGTRYLDSNPWNGRNEFVLKVSYDQGLTWDDLSEPANRLLEQEEKASYTKYSTNEAVVLNIADENSISFITHSRWLLTSSDRGKTWRVRSRYSHDDQQVGVQNFGYKDDGTEWMFESTSSIEGIRSRLKTRDSDGVLTRNVLVDVYLTNCFYLGGNTFIASGQTGDLRRDHDRAVIFITNDNGSSWQPVGFSSRASGVTQMQFVRSDLLWALCDDGSIVRLTKPSS